jgi:hypothetical protein
MQLCLFDYIPFESQPLSVVITKINAKCKFVLPHFFRNYEIYVGGGRRGNSTELSLAYASQF